MTQYKAIEKKLILLINYLGLIHNKYFSLNK